MNPHNKEQRFYENRFKNWSDWDAGDVDVGELEAENRRLKRNLLWARLSGFALAILVIINFIMGVVV